MPSPMPLAPPVMEAVLPAKSFMALSLFARPLRRVSRQGA